MSVKGRLDVEQSIRDQEATLDQVARLLEDTVVLKEWPDEPKIALILALADDTTSPGEGWKVVTLRRHLFGAAGVIPRLEDTRAPSLADRRRAERLRSDLPARVRFRAAAYLVAEPL